MIPPVPSLVSYDKPVLVSSSKDAGKAKKGKLDALKVDKKSKTLQAEDILNAILPPRFLIHYGLSYTQLVIWIITESGRKMENCGCRTCLQHRQRGMTPLLWG